MAQWWTMGLWALAVAVLFLLALSLSLRPPRR